VVPLTCYRTQPALITPESIWSIEKGLDAAVFASPSAVHALWSALPETAREVLRKSLCLPIGPTTAKALVEVGLEAAPPPAESTTDGIVKELQRHFSG
jgi:uroporphyrinogen-III synthase